MAIRRPRAGAPEWAQKIWGFRFRSGETRNFWGSKPESRLLDKNPDDLPNFLGSPADPLFGSQRALVSGDLRVPKGDPGSGPQTDPKMG